MVSPDTRLFLLEVDALHDHHLAGTYKSAASSNLTHARRMGQRAHDNTNPAYAVTGMEIFTMQTTASP